MSALKENDIAVLNYIFDPNITGNFDINGLVDDHLPLEDEDISNPSVIKAKQLEVRGVKLAEEGQVEEALKMFTEALSLAERASGYNNRAQAYRLLGDENNAMLDIEKALTLSKRKGRVGCQALCQRGVIFRKLGNDEKAKADFNEAAKLGSEFAKKQLVEMNPYAAMCNQMMCQMLSPKEGELT